MFEFLFGAANLFGGSKHAEAEKAMPGSSAVPDSAQDPL